MANSPEDTNDKINIKIFERNRHIMMIPGPIGISLQLYSEPWELIKCWRNLAPSASYSCMKLMTAEWENMLTHFCAGCLSIPKRVLLHTTVYTLWPISGKSYKSDLICHSYLPWLDLLNHIWRQRMERSWYFFVGVSEEADSFRLKWISSPGSNFPTRYHPIEDRRATILGLRKETIKSLITEKLSYILFDAHQARAPNEVLNI